MLFLEIKISDLCIECAGVQYNIVAVKHRALDL